MTFNKPNTALYILTILIGGLLGYILSNNRTPVQTITIEQMMDSLEIHDKNRDRQIRTLRILYSQDSMALNIIRKRLDEIPKKTVDINKYYEDKRNCIANMSVDSQVIFMSDWLSKEDSSR